MKIDRVIIPAAGLGTRFLPFTKVIPKEMLPIINRPAIEYVVQEAIQSGISNLYFIASKYKKTVQEYFNFTSEFNDLIDKDKLHYLTQIYDIIKKSKIEFINQEKQLGLGHAVLMAKGRIDTQYFAIMLPDDIIISQKPGLEQLIEISKEKEACVIAVQEVAEELISSYGIVKIKDQLNKDLFTISDVIEKPYLKDAPSNLAIVGRYIFSSKIFESLENLKSDLKKELELTDAIRDLLKRGEKILAYKIQGKRFDIGTPPGWIKANMEIFSNHPDYQKYF